MKLIKPHPQQTLIEEIGNATTHAIGALLSLVALSILVGTAATQHNIWKTISSIMFGSTLFLMYLSSTFYHSIQQPQLKKIFRLIDHSAIFLLIAGTYTPFLLVTLRGDWGWSLFALIWGFALLGIIFELFFIGRHEKVTVGIYLLMGWIGVIAIKPMIQHLPTTGLYWLMAGGLCYTVGVIFYVWRRLHFSHLLWHLFVLAGSMCHFFAILRYVVKA